MYARTLARYGVNIVRLHFIDKWAPTRHYRRQPGTILAPSIRNNSTGWTSWYPN